MSVLELSKDKVQVDMKEAIDAFLNHNKKIMVARKGEEGYFAAHYFYPKYHKGDYEVELEMILEFMLDGEWYILDEA